MQLWFIHLYYYKTFHCVNIMGFPGGPMIKNPPSNAGDARDVGSITWIGRSPGEINGNPLQYSCLENPMDREARWAAVCGVSKSQTLPTIACQAPLSMEFSRQEYWSGLPCSSPGDLPKIGRAHV